eukprot:TRINITY_DN11404_c0_g1_i1.p1 TRINITY_DN11404_c0_g1~~TRINITY_DN11404_c0_g1_i1.p1  ORF type:complete len:397 (+),score=70.58 TRINITY_DN11404_c0_g1_i1:63-1253(+)
MFSTITSKLSSIFRLFEANREREEPWVGDTFPFEKLPSDLQQLVVSFLTVKRDLIAMKSTCKKWHDEIVKKQKRLKFSLLLKNENAAKQLRFCLSQLRDPQQLHHVHLSSATSKMTASQLDEFCNFLPSTVESLSCRFHVPQHLALKVFSRLQHLQHLDLFGWSVYSILPVSLTSLDVNLTLSPEGYISNKLTCTNLKTLKLKHHELPEGWLRQLPNLTTLDFTLHQDIPHFTTELEEVRLSTLHLRSCDAHFFSNFRFPQNLTKLSLHFCTCLYLSLRESLLQLYALKSLDLRHTVLVGANDVTFPDFIASVSVAVPYVRSQPFDGYSLGAKYVNLDFTFADCSIKLEEGVQSLTFKPGFATTLPPPIRVAENKVEEAKALKSLLPSVLISVQQL